jgi:hypothetical protein
MAMAKSATQAVATDEEGPIQVQVTCRRCGRRRRHGARAILIHPDAAKLDWDGIVFDGVIVCPCGAEDEYDLDAPERAQLALRMLAGDPRVTLGEARLWDGTVLRRPLEGLRRLREWAEANPRQGEGWRRLGNFAESLDRPEEAVAAWHEAVAVDDREVEAACSLARHALDRDDPVRAFHHAQMTLARWKPFPVATLALARFLARLLIDLAEQVRPHLGLLASWEDGSSAGAVRVRVSTAELGPLTSEEHLQHFLFSPELVAVSLTHDLPEQRPTQLELLLAGVDPPQPAPRQSYIRQGAKVGRNAPCPCGSGKKHKRCCAA